MRRHVPKRRRAQLERMLRSRLFVTRPRMADLLRFFVEESLRNEGVPINQRLIATHALGLPDDFQPTKSGYVRTHVTRLRQALRDYYATIGRNDPIVFDVTAGPYRLIVTEGLPAAATDDPGDEAAAQTRLAHRHKPMLLLVEPDADLCLGRPLDIGRDIALRLAGSLVPSPFVRASGPLLRSDLADEEMSGEAAAAEWGYDYLCEITLRDSRDGGVSCAVTVADVSRGQRILDQTIEIQEQDEDLCRKALAHWLFHRLSEVFMRLRGDNGGAGDTDEPWDGLDDAPTDGADA